MVMVCPRWPWIRQPEFDRTVRFLSKVGFRLKESRPVWVADALPFPGWNCAQVWGRRKWFFWWHSDEFIVTWDGKIDGLTLEQFVKQNVVVLPRTIEGVTLGGE